MAAFLAPFKLRDLGRGRVNSKLIEVADNFRPEMILLGHCDLIRNETLDEIRKLLPEVRIAYRNVDPLFVPHNVETIHRRRSAVDTIFITTAGKALEPFKDSRAKVYYMPNPTDEAVECLNNWEKPAEELPYDLFFCGNSNEHTERKRSVVALKEAFKGSEVNFKTFGYFGEPNVWGRDYDAVLAKSKMGLNLNRQEGDYLYSSARLAQLMGNGIVPIIHRAGRMEQLVGEKRAVFFSDSAELVKSIQKLNADDCMRQALGKLGQTYYRENFSSHRVAQYIVEETMEQKFSSDYRWLGLDE